MNRCNDKYFSLANFYQPSKELLIFAMLAGKHKLARYLLEVGDSPLSNLMVGSNLYCKMANYYSLSLDKDKDKYKELCMKGRLVGSYSRYLNHQLFIIQN